MNSFTVAGEERQRQRLKEIEICLGVEFAFEGETETERWRQRLKEIEICLGVEIGFVLSLPC